MQNAFATIQSIETFSAPPDSAGSARAFARIGYNLTEAVADIVDNSIDAGANNVEITLFRDAKAVTAVAIADNGCGMSEGQLKRAMQFATPVSHKDTDLGTYGMGMKTASLSQCRALTVITKADGTIAGCRWTVASIEEGWRCEVLDPESCAVAFSQAYADNSGPQRSGTAVIWNDLDRMDTGTNPDDIEEFLSKTIDQLKTKLGLIFHRFLSKASLQMSVQTRREGRGLVLPHGVVALDPFKYPVSGRNGYPKTFYATLPGVGQVQLHAHIWPIGVGTNEFLLGRKTATPHQGFYFYRNNRLIQAGGWNGVLSDPETELVLARVAVDLPHYGATTNVQKSAIQVSAALSQALREATCGSSTLDEYLKDARKALTDHKKREKKNADAPMILGPGVPAALQRKVKNIVSRKGVVRRISFAWAGLGSNKLFKLDQTADRIILNKRFRRQILAGAPASKADAALIKTLLFLLLQDEFDRQRSSAKRAEWLKQCNAILLEAAKSL